jgi:hypothetical protein
MKQKERALSHDRLMQLLRYEPGTGRFIRNQDTYRRRYKAGSVAGYTHNKMGYVFVSVDGVAYTAHRLAFFYMTGKWPEAQVDHIDMDRANNRFSNLRLANNAQNNQNRRKQSNNTTGYKGVFFDKRGSKKKWYSRLQVSGEYKSLGYFSTAEEAHEAYRVAAEAYHGKFANAA